MSTAPQHQHQKCAFLVLAVIAYRLGSDRWHSPKRYHGLASEQRLSTNACRTGMASPRPNVLKRGQVGVEPTRCATKVLKLPLLIR